MRKNINLRAENEKQLKEIAAFMEDFGIDGVTKDGLINIAINQFYKDFLKQNNFRAFLDKEKQTV